MFTLPGGKRSFLAEVESCVLVEGPDIAEFIFDVPRSCPWVADGDDITNRRSWSGVLAQQGEGWQIGHRKLFDAVGSSAPASAKCMIGDQREFLVRHQIHLRCSRKGCLHRTNEHGVESGGTVLHLLFKRTPLNGGRICQGLELPKGGRKVGHVLAQPITVNRGELQVHSQVRDCKRIDCPAGGNMSQQDTPGGRSRWTSAIDMPLYWTAC